MIEREEVTVASESLAQLFVDGKLSFFVLGKQVKLRLFNKLRNLHLHFIPKQSERTDHIYDFKKLITCKACK